MAQEQVEENNQGRTDDNESRPKRTVQEAWSNFMLFCFICPPIQPASKVRLRAGLSFNGVNEEDRQHEGGGYNKDRLGQQGTLHPSSYGDWKVSTA